MALLALISSLEAQICELTERTDAIELVNAVAAGTKIQRLFDMDVNGAFWRLGVDGIFYSPLIITPSIPGEFVLPEGKMIVTPSRMSGFPSKPFYINGRAVYERGTFNYRGVRVRFPSGPEGVIGYTVTYDFITETVSIQMLFSPLKKGGGPPNGSDLNGFTFVLTTTADATFANGTTRQSLTDQALYVLNAHHSPTTTASVKLTGDSYINTFGDALLSIVAGNGTGNSAVDRALGLVKAAASSASGFVFKSLKNKIVNSETLQGALNFIGTVFSDLGTNVVDAAESFIADALIDLGGLALDIFS
jgi:hypothetical protein